MDNQQPIAPTTTHQEDLVTEGQRKINLIWEWTQAIISIMVVSTNMLTAAYEVVAGTISNFPIILSSAFFLVIGFYFSRTNHAAIGGIGPKTEAPYEGR